MNKSYCSFYVGRKLTFILGLVMAATYHQAKAQNPGEIWGMTNTGGTYGVGTIFKTTLDGSNLSVQYSFNTPTPGLAFNCSLTPAPDSKLYGFTRAGGIYSSGVIFEYDPVTNGYTVDYHINTGTPGTTTGPGTKLTLAASGKLYGFTSVGGSNNLGVMFEFDPTSKSYTKKYDLSATLQGLTAVSDGKLYGLTSDDGAGGYGTVFSFDPGSSTYAVEYNFDLTNGSMPTGSLLEASDGKLYGVTTSGGAGAGVLFQFNPVSKVYTKMHDFSNSTGSLPVAPLVEGAPGVLNGVTIQGGANSFGAIYEYTISATTYTKRFDFVGSATGSFLQIGLMKASNGLLYGVTSAGGVNGGGVLYEYNPTTFAYTKKYDFSDPGRNTQTVFAEGTNNKLYGVQNSGPAYSGMIVEYDFSTSTFTKKIDFQSCPGGCVPRGALLQSSSGKVYGTTGNGGPDNAGTLFELDLATGTPNVKVNFTSTLGVFPDGGVVELNGLLYGVTQSGGLNNAGTLYSYDQLTTVTKLVDFSTYNISSPNRSLVVANGKLYGTTRGAGGLAASTLFEFDPGSNTFTIKYNFTAATGSSSRGLMVLASNGKLYGTTGGGGANGIGVLFEYDITSDTYTKKIDLSTATGYSNFGTLTEGPGGKLYFTTQLSGAHDGGTLQEYNIHTGVLVTKYDFSSNSGFGNTGGLMLAQNGRLYGTAFNGGNNGIGTFYEFDLGSNSFSKKHDFSGPDGATPDLMVPIQLVVGTVAQSIDFPPIPEKKVGDPPFELPLTASSGLFVSYQSSNLSVATVSGNTVTILSDGTTTISASQSGSVIYSAAPGVSQPLVVSVVTGIENGLQSVVAYPNPMKDELIVQLPQTGLENHLSLFSAGGGVIEQRSSTMEEERFSLRDQAKGLYFLRIQTEREIKWLKIIRQ